MHAIYYERKFTKSDLSASFRRKGASPTHQATTVGARKQEWLPFRVVSKYPQCIALCDHNNSPTLQTDDLGDFKGAGHFQAKFWIEGLGLATISMDRKMGEWLAAGSFHPKNFVADFIRLKTYRRRRSLRAQAETSVPASWNHFAIN